MIKTMKSTKRVNFEDCDPFAHLNNTSYLSYFLMERDEQLRDNNVLDVFEHVRQTGNGWAVTAHNIHYLRPARMGEVLEIWTRILAFDRLRNLVEFVMLDAETRQLKSVMLTEFAYFSVKTAKPVSIDDQMAELFSQVALYPDADMSEFSIDDRIRTIRSEIREKACCH